jgi:integrase
MKRNPIGQPGEKRDWQSTQYANLIRYNPSGKYYARIRVKGKLIKQSLKTTKISVAKLRLADLEKEERQKAETQTEAFEGKMTFGEAAQIYLKRVEGDPSLKTRSKAYHKERLKALLKSWTGLKDLELRKISKTDCLNWAAEYSQEASASSFNHTVSTIRHVIEIGVEIGLRYDNPARFIKRVSERPKKLQLPEHEQFKRFLIEIETSGSGFSKPCANLVRFLAFGGFRLGEVKFIKWQDCDFKRGVIKVWGHPEERTKNGEVREVPIIPDMENLLTGLRMGQEGELAAKTVMTVFECQKAMNRAAREIGMTRITHHDLRHLFATRCIESGVDIPTVSRWLGHKDGGALAMKVYGHLRDQHSQIMAQKVKF